MVAEGYSTAVIIAFAIFMVFLIIVIGLIYKTIGNEQPKIALIGSLSITSIVLLGGVLLTGFGILRSDIVVQLMNMASFVIGALVGVLSSNWLDK